MIIPKLKQILTKKSFWTLCLTLWLSEDELCQQYKRDNGTKKAMLRSALNMHFKATSSLSKMCFDSENVDHDDDRDNVDLEDDEEETGSIH